MSHNTRVVALASLGYLALAVAYSWPLAIRLSGVPHDPGDPLLTTWWNAPMFYPATGVLAFSEHLLGLAPIAVPLNLLTGQPLVGHNVAFIATFALSAIGAHFLAYTLTRRHDVSAIAAVAYAFAPYRLPQAPHIQVLASHWTPVCLAALHQISGISQATPLLALASACWTLPMVNAFPLFVEPIPRQRRGVVAALYLLSMALGGAIGDPMNGALFDLFGSYRPLFLMMAGYTALAFVAVLFVPRGAGEADTGPESVRPS